ncbi:MAG: formate dehydrogenase accessory protein FdhE [Desulfobacterales bacterium]
MMKKRQDTAENLHEAIEQTKKRSPACGNILDAFGELIIARTCFRQELSLPDTDDALKPDPIRFSQGLAVLSGKTLTFDKSLYLKAAECLFPAMEKGFPKAARDIHAAKKAIAENRLSPELFLQALLSGEDEIFLKTGKELKMAPQLLRFVMGQMMKPFLEKQAEMLKPLLQNLQWHKGYCAVCGSYPELSLLKGETGERWLKCSVCAYEWRFVRANCPVCEDQNAKGMELLFLEDRPQERAELCHVCKKYLIGFDLRKFPREIFLDIERLGALHLDVAAQEKGFFPMAESAWSVID